MINYMVYQRIVFLFKFRALNSRYYGRIGNARLCGHALARAGGEKHQKTEAQRDICQNSFIHKLPQSIIIHYSLLYHLFAADVNIYYK